MGGSLLVVVLLLPSLRLRADPAEGWAAERRFSGAERRFTLGDVRLLLPAVGTFPDSSSSAWGSGPDAEEPTVPPATKRVRPLRTAVAAGGALLAVPVIGYLTWWNGEARVGFHLESEGWFGKRSYAGGADKASHFVVSYALEELAEALFHRLGHSETEGRFLSVALVTLAGFAIEAGDGSTQYGASVEDATANCLGAVAGATIRHLGLDDTIGVRGGRVKEYKAPAVDQTGGYGSDYSRDVYSVDLKLAGFLPRVGVKPGLARFLLVSATYGTKGYRYSQPEFRQRNIGLDVGLNVPEILRAVGVRDDSWWGGPLLATLTYFRIPYTVLGIRYDVDHRRWSRIDTGEYYDPGGTGSGD